MKYKWLLFDADGTLFDYDAAESFALGAALRELGIEPDIAIRDAYRKINQDLFVQFEQGLVSSLELRTRRFELLFDEVKIGIDVDIKSFSNRYLGYLSKGSMLLPGALSIVRDLHPLYKMMIITNGLAEIQRPRFADSGIDKFFFDIIISEEVGSAKPSSGIFDTAFQRMGHPDKNEVLIIGDSLSSDIAGGLGYGIDTCWYNPNGSISKNDSDITYIIEDLYQLKDILIKGSSSI